MTAAAGCRLSPACVQPHRTDLRWNNGAVIVRKDCLRVFWITQNPPAVAPGVSRYVAPVRFMTHRLIETRVYDVNCGSIC